MPALKITITTAGRAALVNAKNTGTNTVLVSAIGITATRFVPNAGMRALPSEIKRITTIAGGATASDTLHVTVKDDSTDAYALNGLGIYLADNTLFGVFSQDTTLLQKSMQATMLLAIDVQFTDIDATQLTLGDTNFSLSDATTEMTGVVFLATVQEAIAGSDKQKAIVPVTLKAALDDRLGTGAPSTVVKSLLTAASSAAFRLLLGIKNAASFDAGAGNGLDADLLDGQHGAYYASNTAVTSALAEKQASLGFTPVQQGTGTGQLANTIKLGWSGSTLKATVDATDLGSLAFQPWVAANYAGLVSPALTGTPTAPTAADGSNTAQIANTAFVMKAINGVINGAPGALDTLKELADAMGDDPHFAATMVNALAGKQPTLGFTPVQQGTGVGQGTNLIKIGWSAASKVKVTVDVTDMGNIALENWVSNTFMVPNGQYNAQNFQLKSGAPPSMATISASGNDRNTSLQISNGANNSASAMMTFIREGLFGCHFGLDTDNMLKVGGWSFGPVAYRVVHEGLQTVNLPGLLNVVGSITSTQNVIASQNFIANSANVVLGTSGTGTVYFRPNGPNSTAGQARIDTNGHLVLAGNVQATYLGAGVSPTYPLDVMTASNGRVLMRARGADSTLDFVNAANNAYAPGAMTATSFSFNVGDATFNGQIVANGGFQVSDARLKHSITTRKPRPLHRAIRHKQWFMRDDDTYGMGLVAQDVHAQAPEYVTAFAHSDGERLAVDKAGVALEIAQWCGNETDSLRELLHTVIQRLDLLEQSA